MLPMEGPAPAGKVAGAMLPMEGPAPAGKVAGANLAADKPAAAADRPAGAGLAEKPELRRLRRRGGSGEPASASEPAQVTRAKAGTATRAATVTVTRPSVNGLSTAILSVLSDDKYLQLLQNFGDGRLFDVSNDKTDKENRAKNADFIAQIMAKCQASGATVAPTTVTAVRALRRVDGHYAFMVSGQLNKALRTDEVYRADALLLVTAWRRAARSLKRSPRKALKASAQKPADEKPHGKQRGGSPPDDLLLQGALADAPKETQAEESQLQGPWAEDSGAQQQGAEEESDAETLHLGTQTQASEPAEASKPAQEATKPAQEASKPAQEASKPAQAGELAHTDTDDASDGDSPSDSSTSGADSSSSEEDGDMPSVGEGPDDSDVPSSNVYDFDAAGAAGGQDSTASKEPLDNKGSDALPSAAAVPAPAGWDMNSVVAAAANALASKHN